MMHKGGENCEGEENLRMVQFPNLLPLEHEIRFRESRVPSGHGFIYRLDPKSFYARIQNEKC